MVLDRALHRNADGGRNDPTLIRRAIARTHLESAIGSAECVLNVQAPPSAGIDYFAPVCAIADEVGAAETEAI